MEEILSFIKVFQSPSNKILFTECACYWFAFILKGRFGGRIMYNPHAVHFATEIRGSIYDINGLLDEREDYIPWSVYENDCESIVETCIHLKGGE